jgi:hypothetical protein
MPVIEFNQGIPDDIDNADYLDVSQRTWSYWTNLWLNLAKIYYINVLLIFLLKEAITEICLSSTLFKIYFIRANKWEILALMPIILCCSGHQEINSKFICLQGK